MRAGRSQPGEHQNRRRGKTDRNERRDLPRGSAAWSNPFRNRREKNCRREWVHQDADAAVFPRHDEHERFGFNERNERMKRKLKRKILRALDFSAMASIILGGSAADWTPLKIVMPMILIPCCYIGIRQWAEKRAYEAQAKEV